METIRSEVAAKEVEVAKLAQQLEQEKQDRQTDKTEAQANLESTLQSLTAEHHKQVEEAKSRAAEATKTEADKTLKHRLAELAQENDDTAKRALAVALQEQKDVFDQQVREMQDKVDKLQAELNAQKEAKHSLQSQFDSLLAQHSQIQNQLYSNDVSLDNLQAEIQKLSQDISLKNSDLLFQSNLLNELNTSYQDQISRLLKELKDSKELNEHLKQEIEIDREKYKKITNELSEEINRHKNQILDKIEDIRSLRDQRDNELLNFSLSISEFNKNLETERAAFNENLEILNQQKRHQMEILTAKIHELIEHQAQEKANLEFILNSEKEDKQRIIDDYNNKDTLMKKLVDQYTRKLDKLKLENEELRSVYEEAKKSVIGFVQKIEENEGSDFEDKEDVHDLPLNQALANMINTVNKPKNQIFSDNKRNSLRPPGLKISRAQSSSYFEHYDQALESPFTPRIQKIRQSRKLNHTISVLGSSIELTIQILPHLEVLPKSPKIKENSSQVSNSQLFNNPVLSKIVNFVTSRSIKPIPRPKRLYQSKINEVLNIQAAKERIRAQPHLDFIDIPKSGCDFFHIHSFGSIVLAGGWIQSGRITAEDSILIEASIDEGKQSSKQVLD